MRMRGSHEAGIRDDHIRPQHSEELKMEKKTEIKKIVIDIDGREISLPVDKAKKLYEVLGELFEERIKEVHRDNYYPYRRWWWYDTVTKYPIDTPIITCDTDKSALGISVK